MKKLYLLLAFLLVQVPVFANDLPSGSKTEAACATIALLSGPSNQTICLNTAISQVSYIIGNGGTGATITAGSLPAGVTSSYNATTHVLTISGTATVAGSYNFEISTTGGDCPATITGAINVNPNATITLVSTVTTTNQTVCLNNPIMNIIYSLGNGATNASVAGLPPGVTSDFVAGILTIFGTPTVVGTFPYTVATVGGCSSAVLSGTITVVPDASVFLTSPTSTTNQTVCVNVPISPIQYTVGNGATGASTIGLPAGVTGTFSGNVLTISGASPFPGVYNFMVTTSGGCGMASLIGILTILPNASINLFSGAGSDNQTICQGTSIVPIVYYTQNGVSGVNVTGLPIGVTASFDLGNAVIAGAPMQPGTFNYTVTTVSGCSTASATGTIIVLPTADLNLECSTASPSSINFDWDVVPGATAYNYSYTIGSGPAVTGTIASVTNFAVPGVASGQPVVFAITSVNGNAQCFSPEVLTCLLQPLANAQFNDGAFSHYPNPVTDVLYLEYDQPFSYITIYNTIGQQVLRQRIDANKAAIDVSSLQSGVYLAKVVTATAAKTIRLVKN